MIQYPRYFVDVNDFKLRTKSRFFLRFDSEEAKAVYIDSRSGESICISNIPIQDMQFLNDIYKEVPIEEVALIFRRI